MRFLEISTKIKRLASLDMPVEALKVLLLDLAVELDSQEARLSRERERKFRGNSAESSGNSAENAGNSAEIPRKTPEIPRKSADIPASRVVDSSSSFLLTTEEERKNPPPSPSKATSDPDGFEEFWQAYPKRDGNRDRKGAVKAFRAARKRADLPTLIAGAAAYSSDLTTRGKAGTEFVKQARTWLNNDGWEETYGKELYSNGPADLSDAEREKILQRLRA